MLSSLALSVWAKSDREAGSLSLVRHLEDAAAVAGLLWDNWLPRSVTGVVSGGLPQGRSDGRVLAMWLAGSHDVGKASPAFAVQVPELADRMRRVGLLMPDRLPDRAVLPHGLAGHVAVEDWLTALRDWDWPAARRLAAVVGGHHGIPPTDEQLLHARSREHLLGDGSWCAVRYELLTHMAAVTGAGKRLLEWRQAAVSRPAQVLLTAVTVLADWIASNVELFPYGDGRSTAERAGTAWGRLGLLPAWSPALPDDPDALFGQRFGFRPGAARPVQVAAVRQALTGDAGLLVIEAPMGEGKTEAALAAAEVLAARAGAGGCFIALPTMATSDAMFGRVQQWTARLPDAGPQQPWSLYLAHGKAQLNESWAGLVAGGRVAGVGDEQSPAEAELASQGAAVAHQWLSGRRKGVLASFVVGTIDQVLLGALQSRHVALRHLAPAGKVVIIDEVHAADSYMSTYLERVLSWLGAYHVPTVLLSATLPGAQRRALVEAYASARSGNLPPPVGPRAFGAVTVRQPSRLDGHIGYPVLTDSAAGAVRTHLVPASGRGVQVLLERLEDSPDVLARTLRRALADGGVVGVLRNTVRRAQDTAADLRVTLPGVEVALAHSRFLAVDRLRREALLRERLGPPELVRAAGVTRPRALVLVGTQVLEQSLDIDLDLLVTDLAPVDLMLQRIGRLHRHARPIGERPAALRESRCLVTGVQDWGGRPPEPVPGSRVVYGRAALLRSCGVLDPYLSGRLLCLPGDIAPLVQGGYAAQPPVPPEWVEPLQDADLLADRERLALQSRARSYLLPSVHARDCLVSWLDQSVDQRAEQGEASVRDAEEGVEAVVVQLIDGDLRLLPWVPCGGASLPTEHAPPDALARVAAACTVRLPLQLTRGPARRTVVELLQRAQPAAWATSRWLRDQLILVLDANSRCELDGQLVTYDQELGLLVGAAEAT